MFCNICLPFFFSTLQIQELGLQTAYQSDDGTFKYLREIMALPFLPPSQIPAMFTRLQLQATTEPLQKIVDYVDSTWVQSTTWPPSCWSVYKQQIRTNNDVEGWHNGLNKRASGRAQMPLYMLINLLHKEACLVALQIRLVSERKLTRLATKGKVSLCPSENIKLLGAVRLPPKVSSSASQGLFPYQWTNNSELNRSKFIYWIKLSEVK